MITLRWSSLTGVLALATFLAAGQAQETAEAGLLPPLIARAGDRSVALHWKADAEATARYRVLRTDGDGSAWRRVGPDSLAVTHFCDLTVTNGTTYRYRISGNGGNPSSNKLPEVSATPRSFRDDDDFLDLVQATAFDFFWREANPHNGLIKDRSTPDSFSSIAAVGFGLTAVGIGIDHGWITRAAGRERTLTTLTTFLAGRQGAERAGTMGHRGWFYHFLDRDQGTRFRQVELSSIDTALFLAGAVYAREYFDGAHPDEQRLRGLVDRLLERVDWRWMTDGGESLTMGWHPESGFLRSRWVGYNEAMILYLLALGAPSNPLPPAAWAAWTRGYKWESHFGQDFVVFPPLFGHQYSHCWVDFRGLADDWMRPRGIDYFENSRRATLAQQAYCTENPGRQVGYGARVWGLTACDGPNRDGVTGYAARGGPPPEHDDGTIAPTAAGGSVPFAPEICIPTLRHFYETWRPQLWTAYGFRDAFNLRVNWWDPDVLGIDQGPILLMIENHRTGRVWKTVMKSAVIQRGLTRAGFKTLPAAVPAGK